MDEVQQFYWDNGYSYNSPTTESIYKGESVYGDSPPSYSYEDQILQSLSSRFYPESGDKLIFLDPYSLKPTGELSVTLEGKAQFLLNELEYISGEVWANIWKNDQIVIIDPLSGKVKSIVDLSNFSERKRRYDVSNGIAFDKGQNTVYLTGKNWSFIYVVTLDQKRKTKRNLVSRAYSRFGFLLR